MGMKIGLEADVDSCQVGQRSANKTNTDAAIWVKHIEGHRYVSSARNGPNANERQPAPLHHQRPRFRSARRRLRTSRCPASALSAALRIQPADLYTLAELQEAAAIAETAA